MAKNKSAKKTSRKTTKRGGKPKKVRSVKSRAPPTKKKNSSKRNASKSKKVTKQININHITKIEGHASLKIRIVKGEIKEVDLYSEEGARFFEGLVKGRNYDDTVEMTSRICGICSTAHITAALKALERGMNVKPSKYSRFMREFLAIGERIRSHATHLYFLVLPDYLGYESALAMAPKYKKQIKDALALMKLGNTIIETFGGRQIHPVGARIGGMTLAPKQEHLAILKQLLKDAKEQSLRTLRLFAGLKYPDFERPTEYFCLQPDKKMPLIGGHLMGSDGRRFDERDYEKYFTEFMDTRGTSKNMVKKNKSYRVGALARVNNNTQMIKPKTRAILKKHKLSFPSHNPFHTTVAQAVELYYWTCRAEELLKHAKHEHEEFRVKPRAGRGVGAVEAPRGVVYHDYTIDAKGYVKKANIITPTVQNLRAMEDDIKAYLPSIMHLPKDKLVLEIEKLIRAYDPCFSCSTHFLKVDWQEE